MCASSWVLDVRLAACYVWPRESGGIMRRLLLIVAALIVSASAANATVVSADLYAPGDGLLTLDSSTSLEWLDLTATVGQTRSAVLSGSFAAQGFRYATQAEVLQLWTDAGATGPFDNELGSNVSIQNVDTAELLINLMGCTTPFASHRPCDGSPDGTSQQNWNIGFFGSDTTDAAIVDLFFGTFDPRNGMSAMWIDFGTSAGIDLFSRPDIGSYLVRAVAVPEPGSLALFAFACAAILRRRARSPHGQAVSKASQELQPDCCLLGEQV